MDTVIAEAARNNVKLVIALMNNWNYNPLQTDWKCATRSTLCCSETELFLCTAGLGHMGGDAWLYPSRLQT